MKTKYFCKEDGAGQCLFMCSLCRVMKTLSARLAGVTVGMENWCSGWIDFAVLTQGSLWPHKYAGEFSYDETFRSCFDKSWEGSLSANFQALPLSPQKPGRFSLSIISWKQNIHSHCLILDATGEYPSDRCARGETDSGTSDAMAASDCCEQ